MTVSRREFIELSAALALPTAVGLSACSAGGDGASSSEWRSTSVVIDASVPLASPDRGLEAVRAQVTTLGDSGVSCAFVPVATVEHFDEALLNLLALHRLQNDLVGKAILVRGPAEMLDPSEMVGIVPQFQGLQMVEGDLELIRGFKALGVGVMALTYNWKNWNGDGCLERTDLPLTGLGRLAVHAMNDAGVLIDLTRAGVRTSLSAIDVSEAPVVFTHSNVRPVHDHPRNLTAEQIDACASTGGVIGLTAFPPLVSDRYRPTLDDFLGHLDYLLDRIGPAHIGLGLDFDDRPRARFPTDRLPDPPYRFPAGLSGAEDLGNLQRALEDRGLSASERAQVMGGNLERVLLQVWGQ